ncbi:GyrI-like domain-containing protein [Paenibacillus peoriae]|uniref:GyrI-like domain-containing protein n=1 Tax=Paenibacillus peoriae TaxID=59893 RepID=UPI00215B22F6|nr:GyrI-like domain-containing protein [Paenibacillus peoriae]
MDQDENEYDFTLPSGEYLSLYYRGGYHQSTDRIIEVITYAKENNLKILGSPFEIYEVDNRDTILEEEYLTEIQVRVGNQTVTS